jgi:ElaB/YqjD/DUF883 family membrane-anchored ribosome-binding protein
MSKDDIEGAERKTMGKDAKPGRKTVDDKQNSAPGLYDQAADSVQSALGHAKDALASGVSSVADAMRGAADKETNPDLGALREDLAKHRRTVSELVERQAASRREQVMDALGGVGETISESASAAQDKMGSIEADLESRIQRNPWSAIAIALGVGILIGKMS